MPLVPVGPTASRRRHLRTSFALFLVLGFHVGVWAVQLGSLTASLRLDPAELGDALGGGAAGGIQSLLLGGVSAGALTAAARVAGPTASIEALDALARTAVAPWLGFWF